MMVVHTLGVSLSRTREGRGKTRRLSSAHQHRQRLETSAPRPPLGEPGGTFSDPLSQTAPKCVVRRERRLVCGSSISFAHSVASDTTLRARRQIVPIAFRLRLAHRQLRNEPCLPWRRV